MMTPPATRSDYSELFYHLLIESKHRKLYNMDFFSAIMLPILSTSDTLTRCDSPYSQWASLAEDRVLNRSHKYHSVQLGISFRFPMN